MESNDQTYQNIASFGERQGFYLETESSECRTVPSTHLSIILLGFLPAIGCLFGWLIAETRAVSEETLKTARYVPLGLLLSLVVIELLPTVFEAGPPWFFFTFFLGGGFISISLDRFTGLVSARTSVGRTNNSTGRLYIGITVDLLIDAVMIGVVSTISIGLGFLLAIGQVTATIPEGIATTKIFQSKKIARQRRFLLFLTFALPILFGVTSGYWLFRGQPVIFKFGLLAVTAGSLVTATVEEILPNAYREDEARLIIVELVGGYTLVTLIAMLWS